MRTKTAKLTKLTLAHRKDVLKKYKAGWSITDISYFTNIRTQDITNILNEEGVLRKSRSPWFKGKML